MEPLTGMPPDVLAMAQEMLTALGDTVLPAFLPEEALRLSGQHAGRIDLLMTDVVMPEMNGRELAQNLLARYPDLKFLFMSGYTADVVAPRGVLAPDIPFIQNPFTLEELATKLRELLPPIPCPQ